LSLLHTYGVKRFSTLARLHGAGFKVLSRLNHTLSPRYRRLKAVWDRVGMPFELWLGRGLPLDPYLRGYLFDILRKAYKPNKYLFLPPLSLYPSEVSAWFTESSLMRAWMGQWLDYVRWYHTTASIVERHWKTSRSYPLLVRFGLMWRLYDEVGRQGLAVKGIALPALVTSTNKAS
ncbi:hypothetical protein Lal_00015655, partial [Lupinus albus]